MFYCVVSREPGCLNDGWEISDKPIEIDSLGQYELYTSQRGFKIESQDDQWNGGVFAKGGTWVINRDNGDVVASATW